MPRFRLVMSALLAMACSGVSTPNEATGSFAALLGGASQVFVLGIVENQQTDPIVTFDHQCAGVHRQTLLRDTIELHSDGTARRAIYSERLADGEIVGSSYIPASGTWTSSSPTFASGSRLTLTLSPASGTYSMPLRIRGDDQLSIVTALGGTCSGSTLDGRQAEFVYTNR